MPKSQIETQPESYKLTIMCQRPDREPVETILEETLFPFSIASFEATPDGENWRVEAWFLEIPDTDLCAQLFAQWEWAIVPVMPENWVKKSLRPLDPVEMGRFFVHGSHDNPDHADPSKIVLKVDAGMAFGTGHHETTSACLQAISQLGAQIQPRSVLDLGCGTGLLGMAAGKVWRNAALTFSDIDPDSTEFTRNAIAINGLRGREHMAIITAPGLVHPDLKSRAPYDLIIANILAAPLVRLAQSVSHALSHRPDAHIVLSGLLVKQEQMVANAYRPFGLSIRQRIRLGEWSALILSRNSVY